MRFLDLLRVCIAAPGNKLLWVAKQVVWFLGSCIDNILVLKLSSTLAPAKPTRTSLSKTLTAYWLAMRENFHEVSTLHIALDGGTLFKKPMVVGIIARPDNVGMVFPPQVPLKNFGPVQIGPP